MFRQTLRGVERKKYPKGTGAKMAGMRLMGVKASIKKARLTRNWANLDLSAEEGLMLVPWDAELNADMGEATSKQGFTDVGVQGYRWSVDSDPNNKVILKALGALLEQKGEFLESLKYWERVFKLDPLDMEARSKITQLNASSVIRDGEFDDDGNKKERSSRTFAKPSASKPPQTPPSMDRGNPRKPTCNEPSAKTRITNTLSSNSPTSIAEAASSKMPGAMYQKALELSGGDPNIREQLEDVEIDLMRKSVDIAKSNAAKSPNDKEAVAMAKAQEIELWKREAESYRSRVERNANDLKIKFTLADRFYKLKMFSQAIPLLQAAVQDPRMEGQALLLLGFCFINEKKGKRWLADSWKRPCQSSAPVENKKEFLECHYYLGRLCEEAKEVDKAEEHYGEVLAIDYEYKDALKRMESLAKG